MALGQPSCFSPCLKPALLEGFLEQPFCPHWPKSAQATSTSAYKGWFEYSSSYLLKPCVDPGSFGSGRNHTQMRTGRTKKKVVDGESLAHVTSKPTLGPGL